MYHAIQIILVRAENPSNIGQVARAMKNFGVKNLVLVNSAPHQTEESYTLGFKAKDVLDSAQISSLNKVTANSNLVIGFTRRGGRRRGEGRLLNDLAPQILEALKTGNVSLVFGNEKSGLSNDELAYCHELVSIPTSRLYPSMNLSHAVAVALYEIFRLTVEGKKVKKKPDEFYATPVEFDLLMNDFKETFIALGYDKAPKKNLLNTTLLNLRNFFKRNGIEKREYYLFRAFLSKMLKRPSKNKKQKKD